MWMFLSGWVRAALHQVILFYNAISTRILGKNYYYCIYLHIILERVVGRGCFVSLLFFITLIFCTMTSSLNYEKYFTINTDKPLLCKTFQIPTTEKCVQMLDSLCFSVIMIFNLQWAESCNCFFNPLVPRLNQTEPLWTRLNKFEPVWTSLRWSHLAGPPVMVASIT